MSARSNGDFETIPNPVYSDLRKSLLSLIPKATLAELGVRDISDTVAQAMAQRAAAVPGDRAEREALDQFLHCWNAPVESWMAQLQSRIDAYLNQVGARLNTTSGFFDYVKLSEGRRKQFQLSSHGKLKESDLLFPTLLKPLHGVPKPEKLSMTADGTIAMRP